MQQPRGDLRHAKWLDPECYEAGACQSLKFKAQHEAMRAEIARLRTALRFYARGEHYHLDESEEFDTVSGEPQNRVDHGGCPGDLERLAQAAGMVSYLNHGAASCVHSEGCHGVTQEHLERFAELVRAAERERYAKLPRLPTPRLLASGTLAGKRIELRGWHTDDIEIWERQHGLKFGA